MFGLGHDSHPSSSTACRRFEDQRIAHLFSHLLQFPIGVLENAGTGNNGEPEFAHLLFGPSIISHELHHTGRGANKLDAAGFTHFGEMRAFGEVAVAGMDRIHISNFSSANDTGDVEVAVLTPGRPNAKGFVSKTNVKRVAIFFRVNCYRRDLQFLAGINNTQRDLTAIRNEDFSEHRVSCLPEFRIKVGHTPPVGRSRQVSG